MRTRVAKSLGLAAATVGLVVASLLPATPAFAVDAYVSTNTSGPGGYGYVSAEPNRQARTVTLTACDLVRQPHFETHHVCAGWKPRRSRWRWWNQRARA